MVSETMVSIAAGSRSPSDRRRYAMVRTSGELRIIRRRRDVYLVWMLATQLNFGIPDVDLPWSCGGTVNPSCFVGHQLLVLFLPADEGRQAAELDSYAKLAEELVDTDAWFLVIGSEGSKASPEPGIPIALDRDGKAWQAFTKVAKAARLDRSQGAVFLFTRGGAFHRLWPGQGNSSQVVQELLSRG